ncbi:DUF2325 domain-containing protein [Clostridium saccharobutylicum]|uniref:Dihydroorotate dehydrogenase n=1 Tax=Clostridium saccharobutylicum TaxID=169679 RepID=A0A1S8N291_CLOSA|nr:DUF2325 domain-containing protein [Clostridium saccharobutylicum]OOM10421.1 hypothetical protein CLOSAC_30420 [Clostridium saccharobutylicum]
MKIMIVGGDNINMINFHLCEKGFYIVKHISGRKNNHKCAVVPANIDIVIIFIDYVNHKLSEHIKKETKKLGIKTVYSKRAWSNVESVLM